MVKAEDIEDILDEKGIFLSSQHNHDREEMGESEILV